MTRVSPAFTIWDLPPTVKRLTPTGTVPMASPVESWVLISLPLLKAERVTLTALFWARVLLTNLARLDRYQVRQLYHSLVVNVLDEFLHADNLLYLSEKTGTSVPVFSILYLAFKEYLSVPSKSQFALQFDRLGDAGDDWAGSMYRKAPRGIFIQRAAAGPGETDLISIEGIAQRELSCLAPPVYLHSDLLPVALGSLS